LFSDNECVWHCSKLCTTAERSADGVLRGLRHDRCILFGLSQSTVLRKRFHKLSVTTPGGLECRSTEPGKQRSRHRLDLCPWLRRLDGLGVGRRLITGELVGVPDRGAAATEGGRGQAGVGLGSQESRECLRGSRQRPLSVGLTERHEGLPIACVGLARGSHLVLKGIPWRGLRPCSAGVGYLNELVGHREQSL
jgi:hypothetical protein